MRKSLSLLLALVLALGSLGTAALADETPSVSYWVELSQASNNINSFDDLHCWPLIEANTGIDIKWEHPATGQSAEQFNLIMASGDLPDIMYYAWTDGYPGGPEAAISDGKIIALNDYIEEYAPNFAAYLKAHPDIAREVTTDEGNIYCFPAVYTNTADDSATWQGGMEREPYFESFIGLIIRRDWLEQVNLPVPVTLDDWYVTLKAFKEQLGAKTPLSCMQMFLDLSLAFASAYDVTIPIALMGGGTAFSIDAEGKVRYGLTGDGYREYLAFMNKLYTEGLLDPDFVVQDRTTLQSKVLNNEVGAWIEMMPAGLGTLRNQLLAENPEDPFYPVGVANPVAYEGQELTYFQASYPFRSAGAAVTTSCKDIPTALRLLDYVWGDEGNEIINWGIKGESYDIVDGWPAFTDQIIHNEAGISPSNAHDLYRQLNGPFPMDHWQRLVNKTNYFLAEGEIDENIASLNLWGKNGKQPAGLPGATVPAEYASEYASLYNELSTYAEEMRAKFIMGYESLDNYAKYEQTLEQFGLTRVLEIKQESLDRYYAREVIK